MAAVLFAALFAVQVTASTIMGGYNAAAQQRRACEQAETLNEKTAQLQSIDTQIINQEIQTIQEFRDAEQGAQSEMLVELLKYEAERETMKQEYRRMTILWLMSLSTVVVVLTLKLLGFVSLRLTPIRQ